jgi:hypothetical protein
MASGTREVNYQDFSRFIFESLSPHYGGKDLRECLTNYARMKVKESGMAAHIEVLCETGEVDFSRVKRWMEREEGVFPTVREASRLVTLLRGFDFVPLEVLTDEQALKALEIYGPVNLGGGDRPRITPQAFLTPILFFKGVAD